MVISPEVLNYIKEETSDRFEVETVRKVATQGRVGTYKHMGFWIPVETYRDMLVLEKKWDDKEVPWRE